MKLPTDQHELRTEWGRAGPPLFLGRARSQLLAGAEFFPRAITCTQATQSDSINSIASAG